MKPEKKPQKETPYILKLWGLQLPLARPLTNKDVKQIFFAFLIFLLALAAFSKKEGWLIVGGLSASQTVNWVIGLISQDHTRSP